MDRRDFSAAATGRLAPRGQTRERPARIIPLLLIHSLEAL